MKDGYGRILARKEVAVALVIILFLQFNLSDSWYAQADTPPVESRTLPYDCAGVLQSERRLAFQRDLAPSMGGGSISIGFDVSFPTGWQGYTQTLFGIVYPEIVKIYGSPSNTLAISVKYSSSTGGWNWYDSSTTSITMGFLPSVTPPNTNDPSWDGVFTHELIHGFHDAIWKAGGDLPASWAEEGMAEAAAEIVGMNIQGSRNIFHRSPLDNLRLYDECSYLGRDVVGGTTYSYYKIIPDMFYRLVPSIFWILTTELSVNPSNPYDFLKRLNTRLYTIAASNPTIDDVTFKSAVRFVAGSTLVEGNFADVWVTNQPISYVQGSAGPHFGVYTWYPENLWNLRAFVFDRIIDQNNPWNTREQGMSGVSVTIQVFDSAGSQVASFSGSTGSTGTTSWFNLGSAYPLPFGAYRIVATASGGGLGSTLTSINYARGTGTNWYITGPETLVYGVVINPSGRPIISTMTVTGASLLLSQAGAFTVQPSSTSVRSEFTINGVRIVAKPTPYTRVVWTPPATALSSYWKTCNDVLFSVYNSRSDLRSAYPGVTSDWGTQRGLIHWAATWGSGVDSAERWLGQYGHLYVLADVYNSRPDLQSAYPEAANGAIDNLVSWAARYGVTTDAARSYLGWFGHLYVLLDAYGKRSDLQSAYPQVANTGDLAGLTNWATRWGVSIDIARSSLGWYDHMYALLSVYYSRNDLVNAFPTALGSQMYSQRLIDWAAKWGITTDSAKSTLGRYDHFYVLLNVYNGRQDLQNVYPGAWGSLTAFQGLIDWAGRWGISTDSAKSTLQPYAAQLVLLRVYCARSDLQQGMRAAFSYPMFQSLINWAAQYGVTADSAKMTLQPYATWYQTHKT